MKSSFNFQDGEILLINKPYEWTSFDVVNKLRYTIKKCAQIKKIKVGHAGTLDPLATGLLIVCTGKMTKQINELQGLDKEYTGTFYLGATTPSYDRETEVNETSSIEHLPDSNIQQATKSFIGKIQQVPPIFSAIKKDGKAAYIHARKGEHLKLEPRDIVISDFQITGIDFPKVDFKVHCSKGTYIRSLAHDFGKQLGCGAYLHDLCRTKIGHYLLDNAWQLPELVDHLNNNKHLFLQHEGS